MQVQRFTDNPIITPDTDASLGNNINGPSLIHAPDWIAQPLGRYYLYFAHHDGQHIRLAYSDDLAGPWRIHAPGVLPLPRSLFAGHIASPDVHVDHDQQRVRMYFHGSEKPSDLTTPQFSRIALSADGLDFSARPELLGVAYFRVFHWREYYYALAMPGRLYRSRDGLSGFEPGPTLFTPQMRHSALRLDGSKLTVIYSNAGDCPEHLLLATIELDDDWQHWKPSEPVEILRPEHDYEGANLPQLPSARGLVNEAVCQLRDPALFSDQGRDYLLYSVAGEHGIAIAELSGL